MAWNLGTADFRPIAPMSEWEWHSCHRHYHSVEEFVHYDLFSATTGEKVAEGHKASFCLEDSFCGRYYSSRFHCAYHQQGISVGCADIYGSYLDCQWVDMTGNRAGEYILQVHLNPNRLMVESDYSNNIAKCSITITAYYSALVMTVNGCWLSEISGGISTG
jgi:lysyl oxidase-like protein 2/3/4